jgi:hypothetical protein
VVHWWKDSDRRREVLSVRSSEAAEEYGWIECGLCQSIVWKKAEKMYLSRDVKRFWDIT